jgi:hypothetical protein
MWRSTSSEEYFMISKNIQAKAMRLPRKERGELALALIESLDQGSPEEIQELWLDVAERRYRKFLAGEVKTVSAKEAIARGRRMLRR